MVKTDLTKSNKSVETNCRPASPLDARWRFGDAVYARPCVSGGSRSAHLGGRYATSASASKGRFAVMLGRSFTSLALVLVLTGCVYRLQPYNRPGPEKLHLVPTRPGEYRVRIENHGETPVPPDGRVDLEVPTLPRGCSPYLFGFIKLGDGRPERLRAIQVLRDGKVIRKLSLADIHHLPLDGDGYRLLTL